MRYVFKSVLDPAPIVEAVKLSHGYVWLATMEEAWKVRNEKSIYVAIMESAYKQDPKTNELKFNGYFFSVLGHEHKPRPSAKIPDCILDESC